MAKGTMDAATMRAMQERMNKLNQMMDGMSTQGK
jgi:hypothetical protein